MRNLIGHICLIGLISLILSPGALAQESAPGKLLIKFKDQTSIRKDSEISFTVPFINQKVTLREEGVVLAGKKDTALEGAVNLTPNISNDSPIISVDVKDDSKLQESINKYKNDPRVEYAEPDYIQTKSWTPNDIYFQGGLQGYQWNFERIKVRQAWDITQGGSSQVKVAVIDDGANPEFPEFSGTNFALAKSVRSFTFDSTNECDTLTNITQVLIDGAPGDQGHGTHISGTIAQKTNNNSHSAGIAFNTTIIPIKVYFPCLVNGTPSDRGGRTSDIVAGMNYAVSVGAKVINISLGSSSYSQIFRDAVISATNTGTSIVAAVGNAANRTSSPPINYPAGYPESIAVGASRWDNIRSDYSQYTPVNSRGIDLVAPGGQVYTDIGLDLFDQNNDGIPDGIVQQTIDPETSQPTDLSNWGGLYEGTSMAAPHVTGVVALMLSVNPNLTPAQIKDILKNTAQKTVIPNYNSLEYGAGLLDAYAAVSAALPLPTSTPTPSPTPTPTPTTPVATATLVASPTPTSPIFPTIPISLVGDINHDNVVNMLDYNLFISKFGDAGGTADFDSSGKVDIFDYAIFVSNFGKTI